MDPVIVPKFKIPFSVEKKASVLEQGSLDEIAQSVYVLLSTEIDSRIDLPEYGIESQAFLKGGVDLEYLQEIVSEWDPRVGELEFEEEWEDVIQRVQVMIYG